MHANAKAIRAFLGAGSPLISFGRSSDSLHLRGVHEFLLLLLSIQNMNINIVFPPSLTSLGMDGVG